jgi:hypothetical protein
MRIVTERLVLVWGGISFGISTNIFGGIPLCLQANRVIATKNYIVPWLRRFITRILQRMANARVLNARPVYVEFLVDKSSVE